MQKYQEREDGGQTYGGRMRVGDMMIARLRENDVTNRAEWRRKVISCIDDPR